MFMSVHQKRRQKKAEAERSLETSQMRLSFRLAGSLHTQANVDICGVAQVTCKASTLGPQT